MVFNILIVLAVIIALFLIIAAIQSNDFRVTRSITLSAAAPAVFAHVNNLHKWQAWSPWAKMDPSAVNTFEGPSEGKGASMSWSGNSKVGEGRMTIIDSQPHGVIQIQLDFIKPFAATNTAEFFFKTDKNITEVTWSMFGKKNLMSKAMGLLINCDKMCGDQFEKGLANLKSVVTYNS